MIDKLKKYLIFSAAPLISALITLYVYYKGGIFPFGGLSVAYLDMYQQYVPMLYNIHAIFTDFISILYAPNTGGGMNFFGIFTYYLNPDSLLCLFFKEENIVYFVNILLLVKISLASLFASVCLKYFFKELNSFAAVLLGIMYGFCGYTMLAYQIIGWLNGLVLFPIVMLSLFRLLNEKKYGMYIACLTLTFLFNFYVAIFITGFVLFISALYIAFICDDKKRASSLLLMSTVIALLISAVVLLPSFLSITSSIRESSIFDNVLGGNPYGGGRYLFGQIETKTSYLLCCSFAIPCFIYFMFNLKKYGKMSAFLLISTLLSLIPVFIEPVNVIWHLGSYAGFPLRYGFIQCFMLLLVCGAVLKNKKNEAQKKVPYLISFIAVLLCYITVYVVIVFYAGSLQNLDNAIINSSYGLEISKEAFNNMLSLCAVLICGYAILLIAYKLKVLGIKPLCVFALVLFAAEAISNTSMFITSKTCDNSEFTERIKLRDTIDNLNDDSFYRVKDYILSDRLNTSLISGNTFNHYTSLTSSSAAGALNNMGYTKAWFWISGVSGTAASDSLLSQKYFVSSKTIKNTYLNKLDGTDKFKLYQNPYNLNMGIITNSDLSTGTSLAGLNGFLAQEKLYSTFTSRNLFDYYDYNDFGTLEDLTINYDNGVYNFTADTSSAKIIYEIDITDKEILYFDTDTPYWNSIDVIVNDSKIASNYPNYDINGICELGTFENETITVEIEIDSDIYAANFGIAGIPISKLETLNSSVTSADSFTFADNQYKISADGGESSYMFISVPYDSGFTCYNNGVKTEIFKTFDGFMSIKLNTGSNDITLKYSSPGFNYGLIITILGIVMLALFIYLKIKVNKQDKRYLSVNGKMDDIASYIYLFILVAGVVIMFIFPIAAFMIKLLS